MQDNVKQNLKRESKTNRISKMKTERDIKNSTK